MLHTLTCRRVPFSRNHLLPCHHIFCSYFGQFVSKEFLIILLSFPFVPLIFFSWFHQYNTSNYIHSFSLLRFTQADLKHCNCFAHNCYKIYLNYLHFQSNFSFRAISTVTECILRFYKVYYNFEINTINNATMTVKWLVQL